MFPLKSILTPRVPYSAARVFSHAGLVGLPASRAVRAYSTEKPKKKKQKAPDVSLVPIKAIGVLADFYIPPRLRDCPVTSWHKLILRRIGAFGLNTFSISKFKSDTKLKLRINDWKELAVDKYVKTNKIFAAACSLPGAQRQSYLQSQLDGIAGIEVVKSLAARAVTFPIRSKLEWNLKSIEGNPKLVSFTPIPDSNDVSAVVQFVVKVQTRQEMVITSDSQEPNTTERLVTDYIVITMNPYTDEMAFVGTLFESDHVRGVKPELEMENVRALESYQKLCADIYRAAPPAVTEGKQ
ncbi:CIC11C00000000773 [Sungouiella intermedia]|uniref:CIC11C00000000773 n=1 Tax=Sungouiella intermedia TaxID=45354 RepID=A0A1L0GBD2_9ASCO|nr:CIC11C00000000773 [[Candida] intermedia]